LSASLAASLRGQWRVILALMIREGQAKYRNNTLGFFWTIGEPLVLTCGVIALWLITNRAEGHGNISVIALAVTAYTHLQLWRRTVNPSLVLLHHSGWMFYHQDIHILDAVIALTLIESVSIFASFTIISTLSILFGAMEPIRDPGLVVAAWCLDTLFCFSFSLFMAGMSGLSEMVERLMHPLMYLTLPLTGAFTMTAWLPPRFRVIVEWVPLANAVEMLRAGVFPIDVKTYYSVPLIVFSSLFFIAIGLPIIEYARRTIDIPT
jgi:capsular polysaccharide transport system permease protein